MDSIFGSLPLDQPPLHDQVYQIDNTLASKNLTLLHKLILIVSSSNQEEIHVLIQNQCRNQINYVCSNGWTPLMMACHRGEDLISTIKLLIDLGANINLCNKLGLSAAYITDSNQIIKILLDRGANPNLLPYISPSNETYLKQKFGIYPLDRISLLRIALSIQDPLIRKERISFLIKAGANLNIGFILSEILSSPFLIDDFEILSLFIEAGINVNQYDEVPPLIQALKNNWTKKSKLFSTLLKAGAQIDAQDAQGLTPINYICIDVNEPSPKEKIEMFLDFGANLNIPDKNGYTPLMSIIFRCKSLDQLDIIKRFIQRGANLEAKSNDGWTALMLASQHRTYGSSEKVVEMLIQAGANLNIQTKKGSTALILASRNCNDGSSEKVVEMLIQAGANLNLKNNDGLTALMLAARYCNDGSSEKVVEMLIQAGADLNLKNNDGWTALMSAARYSNSGSSEKVVEMLIQAGADLNIQNNDGWTALMSAARYSNSESSEKVVEMLIRAGADLNIQNAGGWDAFNLTIRYLTSLHKEDIIRLFIEKGADPSIPGPDRKNCLELTLNNPRIVQVFLENKVIYPDSLISVACDEVKQLFLMYYPEKDNILELLLNCHNPLLPILFKVYYQQEARKECQRIFKRLIKHLLLHRNSIRYNPNGIGQKIRSLQFQIRANISPLSISDEIKDYLSITQEDDAINRILEFE